MTVIREAAASATDLGWLMGVVTVLFVSVFVGWAAWAYWPGRRAELDAAARLPLEDT